MADLRPRDEVLESWLENARGLAEDLGGLGQSLQQATSPGAWLRNNPTTAIIGGAAVLGAGALVVYAGRNKIVRALIGGAASAVGSIAAAQAGRWLRRRIAERLMGDDDGPRSDARRAARPRRAAEGLL